MTKGQDAEPPGRPRGGQLSFVMYDQSSGASSSSNSRHVRSHAAQRGWTVRKQNTKESKPDESKPKESKQREPRSKEPKSKEPKPREANKKQASNSEEGVSQPKAVIVHGSRRASANAASVQPRVLQMQRRYNILRQRRSASYFEIVLNEEYPLWRSVGFAEDPFAVYPVSWKPVFGPLIDFWLHHVGPSWKTSIKHQWDEEELARFSSLPLEFCIESGESVLFYAFVAMSAQILPPTHPLSSKKAPRLSRILQTRATKELNAAFHDKNRALSNSTILAVMLLGDVAVLNGRTDISKFIRSALLLRMTELRGGIQQLANEGWTGFLFARWIAWDDRILTQLSGDQLLFPEFKDPSIVKTDWTAVWPKTQEKYYPDIFFESDDPDLKPPTLDQHIVQELGDSQEEQDFLAQTDQGLSTQHPGSR